MDGCAKPTDRVHHWPHPLPGAQEEKDLEPEDRGCNLVWAEAITAGWVTEGLCAVVEPPS